MEFDKNDDDDLFSTNPMNKKTFPTMMLSNLTSINQQILEFTNPSTTDHNSISKIHFARHARLHSNNSVELEDYFKRSSNTSQANTSKLRILKPSTGSIEEWQPAIESSLSLTNNLKDNSKAYQNQLESNGQPLDSPKFDHFQKYLEKKITSNVEFAGIDNRPGSTIKKEEEAEGRFEDDTSSLKIQDCYLKEPNIFRSTDLKGEVKSDIKILSTSPKAQVNGQENKVPSLKNLASQEQRSKSGLNSRDEAISGRSGSLNRRLERVEPKPVGCPERSLKARLQECMQKKTPKKVTNVKSTKIKNQSSPESPAKTGSKMAIGLKGVSKLNMRMFMLEKQKKEIFASLTKKKRLTVDSARNPNEKKKSEFERLLERKKDSSQPRQKSLLSLERGIEMKTLPNPLHQHATEQSVKFSNKKPQNLKWTSTENSIIPGLSKYLSTPKVSSVRKSVKPPSAKFTPNSTNFSYSKTTSLMGSLSARTGPAQFSNSGLKIPAHLSQSTRNYNIR